MIKNLGDTDIPVHKIFNDPGQLRSLAQLQESLDWFSKNVLALANDFLHRQSVGAGAGMVIEAIFKLFSFTKWCQCLSCSDNSEVVIDSLHTNFRAGLQTSEEMKIVYFDHTTLPEQSRVPSVGYRRTLSKP